MHRLRPTDFRRGLVHHPPAICTNLDGPTSLIAKVEQELALVLRRTTEQLVTRTVEHGFPFQQRCEIGQIARLQHTAARSLVIALAQPAPESAGTLANQPI